MASAKKNDLVLVGVEEAFPEADQRTDWLEAMPSFEDVQRSVEAAKSGHTPLPPSPSPAVQTQTADQPPTQQDSTDSEWLDHSPSFDELHRAVQAAKASRQSPMSTPQKPKSAPPKSSPPIQRQGSQPTESRAEAAVIPSKRRRVISTVEEVTSKEVATSTELPQSSESGGDSGQVAQRSEYDQQAGREVSTETDVLTTSQTLSSEIPSPAEAISEFHDSPLSQSTPTEPSHTQTLQESVSDAHIIPPPGQEDPQTGQPETPSQPASISEPDTPASQQPDSDKLPQTQPSPTQKSSPDSNIQLPKKKEATSQQPTGQEPSPTAKPSPVQRKEAAKPSTPSKVSTEQPYTKPEPAVESGQDDDVQVESEERSLSTSVKGEQVDHSPQAQQPTGQQKPSPTEKPSPVQRKEATRLSPPSEVSTQQPHTKPEPAVESGQDDDIQTGNEEDLHSTSIGEEKVDHVSQPPEITISAKLEDDESRQVSVDSDLHPEESSQSPLLPLPLEPQTSIEQPDLTKTSSIEISAAATQPETLEVSEQPAVEDKAQSTPDEQTRLDQVEPAALPELDSRPTSKQTQQAETGSIQRQSEAPPSKAIEPLSEISAPLTSDEISAQSDTVEEFGDSHAEESSDEPLHPNVVQRSKRPAQNVESDLEDAASEAVESNQDLQRQHPEQAADADNVSGSELSASSFMPQFETKPIDKSRAQNLEDKPHLQSSKQEPAADIQETTTEAGSSADQKAPPAFSLKRDSSTLTPTPSSTGRGESRQRRGEGLSALKQGKAQRPKSTQSPVQKSSVQRKPGKDSLPLVAPKRVVVSRGQPATNGVAASSAKSPQPSGSGPATTVQRQPQTPLTDTSSTPAASAPDVIQREELLPGPSGEIGERPLQDEQPNLDQLARQILPLIKRMIAVERERRMFR